MHSGVDSNQEALHKSRVDVTVGKSVTIIVRGHVCLLRLLTRKGVERPNEDTRGGLYQGEAFKLQAG